MTPHLLGLCVGSVITECSEFVPDKILQWGNLRALDSVPAYT